MWPYIKKNKKLYGNVKSWCTAFHAPSHRSPFQKVERIILKWAMYSWVPGIHHGSRSKSPKLQNNPSCWWTLKSVTLHLFILAIKICLHFSKEKHLMVSFQASLQLWISITWLISGEENIMGILLVFLLVSTFQRKSLNGTSLPPLPLHATVQSNLLTERISRRININMLSGVSVMSLSS